MIDLEFIERLIRTLDDSGIDHVEIERGGTRVRISKSPVAVSAPASSEAIVASTHPPPGPDAAPAPAAGEPAPRQGEKADDDLLEITSPMVGTFYRSPSPDSEPYAEVGTEIATGDTLCIIEAMKLMNELEAEIEGVIREICVPDGEPVEYGQVLFRVEPA